MFFLIRKFCIQGTKEQKIHDTPIICHLKSLLWAKVNQSRLCSLWCRTDLLKLALKRESSLLPYCCIREEENLIPLWSNLKGELVCWAGQNMLIWFIDVRHLWDDIKTHSLPCGLSAKLATSIIRPTSSYWWHEPVWVSSLFKKGPRVTADNYDFPNRQARMEPGHVMG